MFPWEVFYEELADVLLKYRTRQAELIQILKDAEAQGLNVIRLKESDGQSDEYIKEIDPFTFYASFNRGTTEDKRIAVADFIRTRLHIKAPVPTSFAGIPIYDSRMAWFFPWQHNRQPDDIPSLWDLAEAVVHDRGHDVIGPLFDRCIQIRGVKAPKLSTGMFLLRPKKYLPCDHVNRDYLKSKGADTRVESFADFRRFVQDATSKFGNDFVKTSHDAYMYSEREDLPAQSTTSGEEMGHTDTVGSIPLNMILYGPPGTGKTYSAINYALRACGIEVPADRREAISEFRRLQAAGRIDIVTFHQSYSYEEFVEGIRPEIGEDADDSDKSETESIRYEYRDGIFKQMAALAGSKKEVARQGYAFDESTVGFWKMSLGNTLKESGTEVYEYCVKHSCLLLGYGMRLDFTSCTDRAAIRKTLKQETADIKDTDYHLVSMNCFRNRMQQGDLVVISDGLAKFRAIGRVTGDYFYASDTGLDHYVQGRPVQWLVVYDESQPREMILKKSLSQMTLYALDRSDLKMDVLKSILSPKEALEPENYVLIIDEINRGNISKIFGELITLLETDKRLGAENEIALKLPYTQEVFGVPKNLHIIGTMNTADRSIAVMDTALRRRFEFVELMPDSSVLRKTLPNQGVLGGVDAVRVLEVINRRITFLYDRDHQIGHSYFMGVKTLVDLRQVLVKKVVPLLQEYFHDDSEKVCIVLGCAVDAEASDVLQANPNPIIQAVRIAEDEALGVDHRDFEDKVLYEVNQRFQSSQGGELAAFFNGILRPMTA